MYSTSPQECLSSLQNASSGLDDVLEIYIKNSKVSKASRFFKITSLSCVIPQGNNLEGFELDKANLSQYRWAEY